MSTTTTTTTNVDVSENKEQSLAVVTNQTFLEEKEIQGLDDSAPSSSSSLSTSDFFYSFYIFWYLNKCFPL